MGQQMINLEKRRGRKQYRQIEKKSKTDRESVHEEEKK